MFLRRGQFRGPGRGGNDRDRGTNQRHSERQGSAVSIEFGNGHRPVAVGGAVGEFYRSPSSRKQQQ